MYLLCHFSKPKAEDNFPTAYFFYVQAVFEFVGDKYIVDERWPPRWAVEVALFYAEAPGVRLGDSKKKKQGSVRMLWTHILSYS